MGFKSSHQSQSFMAFLLLLGLLLAISSPSEAASVFTVTNTASSGAGSLAKAIDTANSTVNVGGPDTIKFAIAGAGPHTITTNSSFFITDQVTINGFTEPGSSANTLPTGNNAVFNIIVSKTGGPPNPVFEVTGAGTLIKGLRIISGGAGSPRGVAFNSRDCSIEGCVVSNASGGAIELNANACRVGGSSAAARMIVQTYGTQGVLIAAESCVVQGSFIGTNLTGTSAVSNTGSGVYVTAKHATIGGEAVEERNVISSNSVNGIDLQVGADSCTIVGNHVGVDTSGTLSLGNDANGVSVSGDFAILTDNVVSGNTIDGIVINGDSSIVTGNLIGTNAAGTEERFNGRFGIWVLGTGSVIGGLDSELAKRNVISGNGDDGLELYNSSTVLSNYIGLNKTGTATIPNGNHGIGVAIQSSNIGDVDATCYVSGNTANGIAVFHSSGVRSTITNCIIGLKPDGTAAGNGSTGIEASFDGITITDCVVSSNGFFGIHLTQNADSSIVTGCYVGTDPTGTTARGNTFYGIYVDARGCEIGTPGSDRRNVFAANASSGVYVADSGSGCIFHGNIIGMDREMESQLSNGGPGLDIKGARDLIVGGPLESQRNFIVGDTFSPAIQIGSSALRPPRHIRIIGNIIGSNGALDPGFESDFGFKFVQSADTIHIGGLTTDSGNTIMNAQRNGIGFAAGPDRKSIRIQNNSIHSNGLLGISLATFGVPTANDLLDIDSGENDQQNYPILDSAIVIGGSTHLYGKLNSEASQTYRLFFYSNSVCDSSGYGEGETPLLSSLQSTNGSGDVTFEVIVPSEVSIGAFITSTATDSEGNTSEFSQCVQVRIPSFSVTPTADTADVFFIEEADLDRDNRQDFVFTGTTADSLFVSFGKPDGTLESPIALADIQRADITIDYLNNDTLLDIMARTSTQLYTLLNLGSRNFSVSSLPLAREVFDAASTQFPSVASGYFNSGSDLDLILSQNRLIFGDGVGGYAAPTTLPFSFDDVDVADFNNDYIDDIVVTRVDSAVVYTNNGSGVFTRTGEIQLRPFVTDFTRVRSSVDLNQDGKADIVTIAGNSTGANDTTIVTAALGNGLGTVTPSDTIRITGRGLNFTVSDIDLDNDLDITIITADTRDLVIYRGDNTGTFTFETTIDLGTGSGALYGLSGGDLDRNGNIDLVAGGTGGNSIILAINQAAAGAILPEEMVVTAFDNAFLSIVDPNGLIVSDNLQSIAGSDYGRVDFNVNGQLDDRAFNYNLIDGEYDITAGFRPAPMGPVRLDVGIGINGFQERTVFQNYNPGSTNPGDTVHFPFQYPDKTTPGSGVPVNTAQPNLSWDTDHAPQRALAITYRIQLSAYHDFRTTFIDSFGLASPAFQIPIPLAADSVYYWRVAFGDNPFSIASALYIATLGCCVGTTGNADCDGTQSVDIADLTILVDHLFISFTPLCCASEGNCDGNPGIDIGDLTALVDHLFISFAPLANCQ